jgi:hypothetical protein
MAAQVNSQNQQNLTITSEHAFAGLTRIYQSGGQAPDLVAKLNTALGLTQAAENLRSQGNLTGAAALETQAGTFLSEVINSTPAAQKEAIASARNRTFSVLASVPIAVVISTGAFYFVLRVWRRYERAKLFEMEIIGEKAKD